MKAFFLLVCVYTYVVVALLTAGLEDPWGGGSDAWGGGEEKEEKFEISIHLCFTLNTPCFKDMILYMHSKNTIIVNCEEYSNEWAATFMDKSSVKCIISLHKIKNKSLRYELHHIIPNEI